MKPCISATRFVDVLHAFETAPSPRFLCVRANHKAPDVWMATARPDEPFVHAVQFGMDDILTVEQMDATIRGLWNASTADRRRAAKLARYHRAKKEKPHA